MSDKATPCSIPNCDYRGEFVIAVAGVPFCLRHRDELKGYNQHDALVEVAKAARSYLEELDSPVPDVEMRRVYRKQMSKALTALDKVKGE